MRITVPSALSHMVALTVLLSAACAPRDCRERGTPAAASELPGGVPEEREPPPGVVHAKDGRLWLDGKRYRFLGVNIYSLASAPPGSGGFSCGRGFTDEQLSETLDEVAAMGANAIRVMAFQSFTSGPDGFARTDRIVSAASERGLKVIFTLENQWEDCTQGGYKYASWYGGKFREPYGDYRLSYKEYVQRFVTHYRDEPAVLMYQLINESEAVQPNEFADPEALLTFAREMAALVKRHDPDHLLSLGTTGVFRPGSGGPFYALLHLVEGVDLVEAHDYGNDKLGLPDDIRIARLAARQISKPFFIGEIGISSPPLTKAQRAHYVKRKLQATWESDVDGVLIWSYRSGDGGNKDFDRHDPLYRKIRQFTKSNGVAPTP